jgi:hypothetical protein
MKYYYTSSKHAWRFLFLSSRFSVTQIIHEGSLAGSMLAGTATSWFGFLS